MGKIKSKLVKKTSEALLKRGVNFTEDFRENKKILRDIAPSKKIRNQIAGYTVKLKKVRNQEKQEIGMI